MEEFCGIRVKMYSIKTVDGKEKKTGKGVSKSVLKRTVRHQHYVDNLFSCVPRYDVMYRIGSKGSQLMTLRQCKKSLCCVDTKRFVLDDNIHTRAIGHHLNATAEIT